MEAPSPSFPEGTSVCTLTVFSVRAACARSFYVILLLFPLLAHGTDALAMDTLQMHIQVACRHRRNQFCSKHDHNLCGCSHFSPNTLQFQCLYKNKCFNLFQYRILAALWRSVDAGWFCRNFPHARLQRCVRMSLRFCLGRYPLIYDCSFLGVFVYFYFIQVFLC